MNWFLFLSGVEQPEPPRRLYALLDQEDGTVGKKVRLLFDTVYDYWFDAYGREVFGQAPPRRALPEYYEAAPVYILQLNMDPFAPPPVLSPLNLEVSPPGEDEGWLIRRRCGTKGAVNIW